ASARATTRVVRAVLRIMRPPRPRSCESGPEAVRFVRWGVTRRSASGPGMELPVHLAQVAAVEVGVNGGGGDGDVTQELLHDAQVGAALQQVGGERVTQGVRVNASRDARAARMAAQDLPPAHARQRPA